MGFELMEIPRFQLEPGSIPTDSMQHPDKGVIRVTCFRGQR